MLIFLHTRKTIIFALATTAFMLSACSSDNESGSRFNVRAAEEITGPVTGGNIVYPQPAAPLPADYVEEEFFIAGTATSFKAEGNTPANGFWDVVPSEKAQYRTRIIVRRPSAEVFSGTVLVEWLNVSAIEAGPDWSYLSEEIGREGHAYIAVSTQEQGVIGGDTILNVSVNDDSANDAGVVSNADNSGLVNINSDRYGSLTHPGDAFAFDIFSQVGRAVKENAILLGGMAVEQVIGLGESQSAYFLTTYANAAHPLDPIYDGLLIHSRGAGAAPLSGIGLIESAEENENSFVDDAVLVRTDLDIPVMIFEAETDLTLLGYANARQPDTDMIRTWEVAGTAHADDHTFRSMLGGTRDSSLGIFIGCTDPINTGPHHEVLQAALHHLVNWAAGGSAPPAGVRIELEQSEELAIARDQYQIALGGVRNPLVDVPVAAAVGDPPASLTVAADISADFNICGLFGTTYDFDQDTLIELHGTADEYLNAFIVSANDAVAAGFLLQADADQLIAEAQANTALFD